MKNFGQQSLLCIDSATSVTDRGKEFYFKVSLMVSEMGVSSLVGSRHYPTFQSGVF